MSARWLRVRAGNGPRVPPRTPSYTGSPRWQTSAAGRSGVDGMEERWTCGTEKVVGQPRGATTLSHPDRMWKFEIRISKFETNPNDRKGEKTERCVSGV